ncbi:MAG: hypothetical protein KF748_08015 [Xanthobacteraceae bacterium]|nr:hypothetical protein [Xanthobacteraceae bacterium]MCW5676615.1 hypothetical protein [Xanthobacteraceae bacterium]
MRSDASYRSSEAAIAPELVWPVELVREICRHAGSHNIIENARFNLSSEGILRAVRRRDSAKLFDWLLAAVSYQGISDYVAGYYMEKNGTVSYLDVRQALATFGSCEKLADFTTFADCGYEKTKCSCTNKLELPCCPVPRFPLRNGRLNQTAVALFLFIRDVAQGDLVRWIDTNACIGPARWAAARLSAGLGAVFGISDKVAALALSGLLLACSASRPRWGAVGAQMVVVDTLVHNFLHRTGILRHLASEHLYGPACYLDGGCSDVLRQIAALIDAKEFNPSYPVDFPRFVQQAIWRYCAELELDFCNGRRINDRLGCRQAHCAVFDFCCREPIKTAK